MVLKALRRSLARAAKELCELPVAVLAARQANVGPEDLKRHLADENLLIVLDGPEGRIGAVTMDPASVTALIQRQTIGVVMGMAGGERNYTSTDAAMCAEFIDDSLSKVTMMLEGHSDRKSFEGYRFGARIGDVRSLLLAMEAEAYRVFDLTLDLDAGKMQGKMGIILPDPSTFQNKDSDDGMAGMSLGSNLGAMRAELQAVLCRFRLPLSEFTDLKEGDMVPLDSAFLYETELIGINGQVISAGRLGQLNGSRAIRLNVSDDDPDGGPMGGGDMLAFSSDAGHSLPAPDPAPMGLGIAANTLQDAGADFPSADLSMGDMPMGDAPMGDLPMGDMPMGDLPDMGLPATGLEMDGAGGSDALLGAGLGGGLDSFNPDDALAEISELAGLEGPDGPA